jgi:Uma2 family endonuclease
MVMPDLAPWTRERVLALPADGNRYELIDGQLLVSPAARPPHQIACYHLARLLDPYVRQHNLGLLLPLAADLEPEAGQLTQPDLFVLPPGPRFIRWEDAPRPRLVVEVLSPSTARYDRGLKRRFYQRARIPEYWIVDLDGRVIERWRPGDERPEVASEWLQWQPESAIPPLELDLEDFFDEAGTGER